MDTPEKINEKGEHISITEYESAFHQILQYIDNLKSGTAVLQDMEKMYWSGELYATKLNDKIIQHLLEIFIAQRNLEWLPSITNHLQQDTSLIAVGATHLYGEHGLIQLLRQDGFSLEPVHYQTSAYSYLTVYYDVGYQVWNSDSWLKIRGQCNDLTSWMQTQATYLYDTYCSENSCTQWFKDNVFASSALFTTTVMTYLLIHHSIQKRRNDYQLRQAGLR